MKEKFQIVTKEFSLSLDRQASISPFITFQQDSKDSEEKYYTFRQFFIIVDFFGCLIKRILQTPEGLNRILCTPV